MRGRRGVPLVSRGPGGRCRGGPDRPTCWRGRACWTALHGRWRWRGRRACCASPGRGGGGCSGARGPSRSRAGPCSRRGRRRWRGAGGSTSGSQPRGDACGGSWRAAGRCRGRWCSWRRRGRRCSRSRAWRSRSVRMWSGRRGWRWSMACGCANLRRGPCGRASGWHGGRLPCSRPCCSTGYTGATAGRGSGSPGPTGRAGSRSGSPSCWCWPGLSTCTVWLSGRGRAWTRSSCSWTRSCRVPRGRSPSVRWTCRRRSAWPCRRGRGMRGWPSRGCSAGGWPMLSSAISAACWPSR